ncbi:MAG: cyclic pyranopterin monophosphate synthase MoaC [Verrucomicrobiota bacterium]
MSTTSLTDVSAKAVTARVARASCRIVFQPGVFAQLAAENFRVKKGRLEEIAGLAGMMGAKKTPDLIPHCHPLALQKIEVEVRPEAERFSLKVVCTCRCQGQTGVEMEALTGASVAALTLYDLCKYQGQRMTISELQLEEKTGGKSDYQR